MLHLIFQRKNKILIRYIKSIPVIQVEQMEQNLMWFHYFKDKLQVFTQRKWKKIFKQMFPTFSSLDIIFQMLVLFILGLSNTCISYICFTLISQGMGKKITSSFSVRAKWKERMWFIFYGAVQLNKFLEGVVMSL